MRKEKLRKAGLYVITGCFIKLYKIKSFCSQDFYFASSFAVQFFLFDIRMMQEISKEEIENGKWLGISNYNIFFKNNFSGLVINVTQNKFSLLIKCAYVTPN